MLASLESVSLPKSGVKNIMEDPKKSKEQLFAELSEIGRIINASTDINTAYEQFADKLRQPGTR